LKAAENCQAHVTRFSLPLDANPVAAMITGGLRLFFLLFS
jgi:hypothetical protein